MTTQATGKSARILQQTRDAVSLARECHCGRRVLADLRRRKTLKGRPIPLCRKGKRLPWLLLLVEAGVVVWADQQNRLVVIQLESPLLFALRGK